LEKGLWVNLGLCGIGITLSLNPVAPLLRVSPAKFLPSHHKNPRGFGAPDRTNRPLGPTPDRLNLAGRKLQGKRDFRMKLVVHSRPPRRACALPGSDRTDRPNL